MGFFSDSGDHAQIYDQVYNGDAEQHKATWSHEAIGGAAAFAAAKAYEDKVARDGKPDSHAVAKEVIAGLAGFEVDRLFETKGLDFIDKEKAKHHAQREAEAVVAQDY